MKRTPLFFILLCITLLCSCAAEEGTDEICYVHCCGFDMQENNLIMSVILESSKTSDDKKADEDSQQSKSKYFVESFTGQNAEECVHALFEKYKKCYSGRSELYIFSENLDRTTMYDIACFIPSTPRLPAQSDVSSVSTTTSKKILELLCKDDNLKKAKEAIKNNSIPAARFFALCTDKHSSVSIPTLIRSDNDTVTTTTPTHYKSCAIIAK